MPFADSCTGNPSFAISIQWWHIENEMLARFPPPSTPVGELRLAEYGLLGFCFPEAAAHPGGLCNVATTLRSFLQDIICLRPSLRLELCCVPGLLLSGSLLSAFAGCPSPGPIGRKNELDHTVLSRGLGVARHWHLPIQHITRHNLRPGWAAHKPAASLFAHPSPSITASSSAH